MVIQDSNEAEGPYVESLKSEMFYNMTHVKAELQIIPHANEINMPLREIEHELQE